MKAEAVVVGGEWFACARSMLWNKISFKYVVRVSLYILRMKEKLVDSRCVLHIRIINWGFTIRE